MLQFKTIFYTPLLLFGLATSVTAVYQLVQDYSGLNFYRGFDFFTQPDPTNGHVVFKSMADANATGIAGFIDGGNATNAIYMAVDSTQVAPQGRASVRVTSKQSYDHFLLIADIVHMPGGICGTWPAFWTVGRNWPYDGEIDIVEGVNDQPSNYMTLHTSADIFLVDPSFNPAANHLPAPLPTTKSFAGTIATNNCAIAAPNQPPNSGCAIRDPSPLTYGTEFNTNGGGVFAVERTPENIRMWFFPRGKFPDDIAKSRPVPSVHWGKPRAIFTGDFDVDTHFKAQQIVFDTTFCGQWAGLVWNQSESCAKLAPTCEEYVSNNPGAFKEAYWAINTLQVWQEGGVREGL